MNNIKYDEYSNKKSKEPYAACIGFFDLIHYKHDEIISKTIQIAKKKQISSLCLTFDIKPADYINSKNGHIWDKDFKSYFMLEKYNFDKVVVLKVCKELLDMSVGEFLNYLNSALKIEYVVIGGFFRFAKDRSGTINDIIEHFGREKVEIVSQNNSISTTLIKKTIETGEIKKINKLLRWKLTLCARKYSNNRYILALNENTIKNGHYLVEINEKTSEIDIIEGKFEYSSNEEQMTVIFV